MSNIVEATSLSSVTSIASHPPSHPHAPSGLPQLPLILYIARVPGSRDVFLTPMKPREKVVTAEDVQSSLYYVHVNGDEVLGEGPPDGTWSSTHVNVSQLLPIRENGIKRDNAWMQPPTAPLTPPYPLDDDELPRLQRRSPSPHRLPILQQRLPSPHRPKRIARKPVKSHISSPSDEGGLGQPVLRSRPLPSPPRDEEPYEPFNGSLHIPNMHPHQQADHRTTLDSNPGAFENADTHLHLTDLPQPGSLTLIRRDPSSNEQWNVASIHDPPVHEISSAALRNPSAAKRSKRGGAPVYLDISNSAYTQFIGTNRAASRNSIASSNSSDSDPPPEGIFRRRLHMPGSQHGEHTYGRSSRPISGFRSGSSEDATSMGRTIRTSADMTYDASTSSTSPAVDDRRGKGYTFTSPWDGRCEFTTGSAGRSLKCRHYLPQHQQQHGSVGSADTVVSELRFNLPTSSKTATVVQEKRKSYMRGLHRRPGSSEDGGLVGDDGKMDLTLGQERAGGGFGGKQAKLGKLIIEPEGLKMLDLLVAANLALWWRAYERY